MRCDRDRSPPMPCRLASQPMEGWFDRFLCCCVNTSSGEHVPHSAQGKTAKED